ncbi:MAG: helix-turn-helix transcriptional regulator [Oscillospiraceae bacterium]|nr:helix-turn-helix transcriptional regulator [Oscillospiraceae bacterium]
MFSEKIKELRKEHNITQVKFAEIFNISSGTIAMWETGKRTPDIETIQKIAKYFNVSVDWLTGNSETRNINNDNSDQESNKAFFRLKKGLEPYDLSESDTDFLLSVFKAHKESNK